MPEDTDITETPPIGEAQTDPAESGCPMRLKPPVEGGANRDWWPNQLNLKILQKNPDVINPLDKGFDYAAAVQSLDVAALARRRRRGDARLAGLVARRLRPLRSAVHPDVLARRGHLPRQRRPRWRRRRHAAVRPAQQLARQRQPGQGPPAAVAGQEEVRQEPVLGRPDRLCGQRRTGRHGLRHRGLRLRSRGPLGA